MFYDYTLNKMILSKSLDELFEEVGTYEFDFTFSGDVQPSNSSIEYKNFGESLRVEFILYTDELLENGDVIEFNDRLFRVENRTCWDDYNIYGIKDIKNDNRR